jgi:hypothetical protein
MNWRVALAAVALAIPAARAASAADPLVTLTPGGGVLNLPGGSSVPLSTIGSRLRKKKVLFVTFRVYTARLLVSAADASKFEKTPPRALDSLDQVSAVVMHLTFQRSVSPQQLSDGLNVAMSANGYDVNGNAACGRC